MLEIVIGIGTNIGNKLENINKALLLLEKEFGKLKKCSNIYQSAPVDYLNQPHFYNVAVLFRVNESLKPHEVLWKTQGIEKAMGREKKIPKGPRNIDLDILYFNNQFLNEPELIIPHPEIDNRDFVKQTLLDLRSEMKIIKLPSFKINNSAHCLVDNKLSH